MTTSGCVVSIAIPRPRTEYRYQDFSGSDRPVQLVPRMNRASRVEQLRDALASGEAFTRLEAERRFGITGSTFRWAIKNLREQGVQLEFEEVLGRRGSTLKRWRMAPANPTTKVTR